MKFKKNFSLLLIMTVCILTSISAFAGTEKAADVLTMNLNSSDSNKLGNTFIYSNSPEQITSSVFGGAYGGYTISKALTKDKMYDADFYHWNYSGKKLRIGVYIYNGNSSTQYVSVSASSSCTATSDLKTRLQRTADNVVNYWSGVGATLAEVPVGGKFICYVDADAGTLATGKVLFRPLADNMWCQIVFLDYNYLSKAKGLPKAKKYESGKCTAAFYGDTKKFTYAATSGKKSFYLATVKPNATIYNTNEYDSPIPYESMGNPQNTGNYGVNYSMYFSSAGTGTKKLRIIPDWKSSYNVYGRAYMSFAVCDASGWRRIDFNYFTQKYVDIIVPSNGNVKFSLPNGAIGNIFFTFDTSIVP